MRGRVMGAGSNFVVSTEQHGTTILVRCEGELDETTRELLREALEIAFAEDPQRLIFDGAGISLLTSQGIAALFELAERCDRASVELELDLSDRARRMLDLMGLWWLGVIDDGVAAETTLRDSLRKHARPSTCVRWEEADTDGTDSEYFLE